MDDFEEKFIDKNEEMNNSEINNWEAPDFEILDANIAQNLPGDGLDGGFGGDSRS